MIKNHTHFHWSLSENGFIEHCHPHECSVNGFNRLHHHAPKEHDKFSDEELKNQERTVTGPPVEDHEHEHWSPTFEMYLSHSHPHICLDRLGHNHHHDPRDHHHNVDDHDPDNDEGVFEKRRIIGEMYA